jgi:hypothetical protein
MSHVHTNFQYDAAAIDPSATSRSEVEETGLVRLPNVANVGSRPFYILRFRLQTHTLGLSHSAPAVMGMSIGCTAGDDMGSGGGFWVSFL